MDKVQRITMWFYACLRVFIIAYIHIKGTYNSINDTETEWDKSPCILAAPPLTYNMSTRQWMVNKLPTNINQREVWIGYINTSVALEYIGCTALMGEAPILVKRVGDCHFTCKGTAFAVQMADVNINCLCVKTTNNMSSKNCTGNCEQFLCGETNTSVYAIYNGTNGTSTQRNGKEKMCLDFAFQKNFTWMSCYDENKRVLCRTFTATVVQSFTEDMTNVVPHAQHFAEVQPDTKPLPENWSTANKLCFENEKLPATINSIQNSITANLFSDVNNQKHWTGIQLAYTLQKAESIYNVEYPDDSTFGYLKADGIIRFEKHGPRSSLCQLTVPTTTIVTPLTNVSTISTNTSTTPAEVWLDSSSIEQTRNFQSTIKTENAKSEESSAVAIGVGISIGTIIIVAGAVFVEILRRRGIWSCCLHKKAIKTSENNFIESNKGFEENPEEPVHNYFILEKVNTRESYDGDINTGDPNLKNRENDNYNSIEDTDKTHTNVKENNCDYDYTSNGKAIKMSCYGPENVYNRLQLDRHGDYDYANGQPRGMFNDVGNDYDTATGALLCMHKSVLGDDSDYNHSNAASNDTQNRINSSKDTPNIDYDVINGSKFTLYSLTMPVMPTLKKRVVVHVC